MRRTPLVRRAALAAATPMLLVALTACGSGDADNAEKSSASSSESESVASEPAGDVEAGEEVDPQTFVDDIAAGLEDLTTGHVAVIMEGGSVEMTAEGDVDFETDPPSVAMKMSNSSMGEETMDIRLVDGTIYASVPGMTNGKFFALDSDDPNNPMGELFTEQFDPRKTFESFGEHIDKVVFVGEEDVDGESLRHFELTLNTDAIKDKAGQMGGSDAKVDLPEELIYDVWLDEANRPSRTAMDLGESTGSMVTEMDGWGEPVSIEAPDESEIIEMPGTSPAP